MIAFSAFSLRGRPAGRAVTVCWFDIAASPYISGADGIRTMPPQGLGGGADASSRALP
ncbi:hypothetical protein GCM10027203_03920 [Nonomuraea fastidiosa]